MPKRTAVSEHADPWGQASKMLSELRRQRQTTQAVWLTVYKDLDSFIASKDQDQSDKAVAWKQRWGPMKQKCDQILSNADKQSWEKVCSQLKDYLTKESKEYAQNRKEAVNQAGAGATTTPVERVAFLRKKVFRALYPQIRASEEDLALWKTTLADLNGHIHPATLDTLRQNLEKIEKEVLPAWKDHPDWTVQRMREHWQNSKVAIASNTDAAQKTAGPSHPSR